MVLLSKDWVIIEYYLKKEERVKKGTYVSYGDLP